MKIFVSGGSKNGKSTYAEDEAVRLSKKDGTKLYYIATMIASDDEDRYRIKVHQYNRRDKGFTTIECPLDIYEAAVDPEGTYLLDSVTALLSNEMFKPDGTMNLDAGKKTAEDLKRFSDSVRHAVLVSDYIYSDARIFDEFTEGYRSALAYVDRSLAKDADKVLEVTYGQVFEYKEVLNEDH